MSTRIAILSDVHADVTPTCTRSGTRSRRSIGSGATASYARATSSTYGKYPAQTIELLRERKIACIRGNHDRWALEMEAADDPDLHLSLRALSFLRSLPTRLDLDAEGVRIAIRHASPHSDMHGIYPSQADADDARQILSEADGSVVIVGHTHAPFTIEATGGGLICNPGALLRDSGEPLNGHLWLIGPKGATETKFDPTPGLFGVLEVPALRFTVHRAADGRAVEIVRSGTSGARR